MFLIIQFSLPNSTHAQKQRKRPDPDLIRSVVGFGGNNLEGCSVRVLT